MAFVYLVVLALVLAIIWINLSRRPRSRARIGPGAADGRHPEGAPDRNQDVELAEEVLPDPGAILAKYGLDEGAAHLGPGEEEEPDFPVEQPEAQDDLTDIPNGAMPVGGTVAFEPAFEAGEELVTFRPDPDAGWPAAGSASLDDDWALLTEHDHLPASYGEDGVVAIVRNPRSLYVYWERAGDVEKRLREMLGEERYRQTIPCLRVFDTAGDQTFTIDLSERDDHWFIHGLEPRHRYVISYERRTPEGRYYLVALSNPVMTPHETAGTRGLLYDRLEQVRNTPTSGWR